MSGEGFIASQPRRGIGNRFRRGTIICPHCNADARITGTDPVTPLVKTIWCGCSNVTCGMTWRMQLSFEYVVSPSAIERPDLNLPQAPEGFRRTIYPAGPPGPEPDPDQFDMFADEEGDDGDEDEAPGQQAAA